MQLKYCVDAQNFMYCIELGFIDDVTSFEDMTGAQLCTYLQLEAKESKEAVTIDALDELIEKKPRMNMENRNAKSRMQGCFCQISLPPIEARCKVDHRGQPKTSNNSRPVSNLSPVFA